MLKTGTVLPVVGVTFYQNAVTHTNVGDMVVLAHDAENPYDANAVVIRNADGQPLGHLPRSLAGRISDPAQGGELHAVWTGTIAEKTSFDLDDGTPGQGLRITLGSQVGAPAHT